MEVEGSGSEAGSEAEDIPVAGQPGKRKGAAGGRGWRRKQVKISQLLKGKAYAQVNKDSPVTPEENLQDSHPQLEALGGDRISLEEKEGRVVPTPEFSRKKLKLVNPLAVMTEGDPGATTSNQNPAPKLLLKNDEVYVRLEENGLHGSWHRAVILDVKPGLRHVQYRDLEHESTGKILREWVQFGKQAPRGRLPTRTRLITDGKSLLRPDGPGNPPVEPRFRTHGGWPRNLWVEVFESNTWWEGVLEEDATEEMINSESAFVDVRYPRLRHIVEEVNLRAVRVYKDWDPETGEWTMRGMYKD